MEITTEIITAFRTTMHAFTDVTKWPDVALSAALCEADSETGGRRVGPFVNECHNRKKRLMFYYAAHWLVSMYPGKDGATNPENIAGGARYSAASKSVGDESISFNSGSINNLSPGDEWLATTIYGQQFLRLRRRVGMGALAV